MQPNNIIEMERVGNLEADKTIGMSIDQSSTAHLMQLLTNLYSDPTKAVIREYSTNARDAQIEAGYDGPIEVSTPNRLSPYFVVKDHGVGMSVEDIENIYSKYGASTKRGTNEQTGMLGLGCKSALTYTGQFVIVSAKNGVKSTVAVSKIEDGTGVMEIVDTSETSDDNGTEIRIPVNKTNYFEAKARELFQYWAPGTVLLNGRAPEPLKGDKITDNIIMVTGVEHDTIVMGGVPYQVEGEGIFTGKRKAAYRSPSIGFVCYVDIGDVNFTPSREALHYTGLTNKTIMRLRRELSENFAKKVYEDIKDCKTHTDALNKWIVWYDKLGDTKYLPAEFKGEPFVKSQVWTKDVILYHPSYSRNQVRVDVHANWNSIRSSITVWNFPSERPSATQKAKLKKWLAENYTPRGDSLDDFILHKGEDRIAGKWADGLDGVDWLEINKLKLSASKKNAAGGGYDVVDGATTTVMDELDKNDTIYYFTPADFRWDYWRTLTSLLPDATLVVLARNRWEKFLRDYPGAEKVEKGIAALVQTTVDSLTYADKVMLYVNDYGRGYEFKLDPKRVDDPELKAFIQSGAHGIATNDRVTAYRNVVITARKLRISIPSVSVSSPIHNYPLLGNWYGNHTEDVYLYINTKYQKTVEEITTT